MKLQCAFEQELVDAVATNRWPGRADPALRSHVAGCPICSDVAVFAAALLDDRDAALAEAAVPPASAVWWRSQLRAREEAARLAARPIVVVQAAATVCAFAASALLAPAALHWMRRLIAAIVTADVWFASTDASFSWVVGTAAYAAIPMVAVGLWLVLAPVVVYLALDD